MKLKVGDKLYCKIHLKQYAFYKSNAEARIFAFKDDVVEVIDVLFGSIKIKNENGKTLELRIDDGIQEMFYTEKEMRKLKLKEIEKNFL